MIIKDRRREVAAWNYRKKGVCRPFLYKSFFPPHFNTTIGNLNPFRNAGTIPPELNRHHRGVGGEHGGKQWSCRWRRCCFALALSSECFNGLRRLVSLIVDRGRGSLEVMRVQLGPPTMT
ncbi:hypothetical protein ARMGADRAFT_692486 [Armillaria gallica]|uniref:Uncharacterized protein n=1 Tax=Armillaria gallica TaxID=47427 RepID=A0A2H3DQJ7_ARMGA|nr:hypothetical protein ARMGADRAFT_692486 [Armillaria gallica]